MQISAQSGVYSRSASLLHAVCVKDTRRNRVDAADTSPGRQNAATCREWIGG